MTLEAGARLGPYEILSPLGRGGMGEVYRARDTSLGRDVAIKVLPEGVARDEARLSRFRREAQTLASLDHPNVGSVYAFREAEGSHFLVMQLVEGDTLADRLSRGPMPLLEAVAVFRDVAHGLAASHTNGIVHRDLKPENLKIDPHGRVKILDFGLAKAPAHATPGDEGQTLEMGKTVVGEILGTPAYMSPEQARGQAVDGRTDLWSFGVCLFEALSGQRPFQGRSSTATDMIAAIIERDPDWSRLPGGLPREIVRLLHRCLEKDARRRPVSAHDLALGLEDLEADIRQGYSPAALATSPEEEASEAQIRKLAVLPLRNISGDAGQEYFADGMTEAIITELAKIKALRVISRTSVMQYKATTKPMTVVARELGVDALVEGSVLRAGDQVRITAQLIGGRSDEHLWADSYDGTMAEIFTLQKEVALAIAKGIDVTLTPGDRSRMRERARVSPEAYDLLLQANRTFGGLSPEDIAAAQKLLRRAIALDGRFAQAYATLAYSYWQRGVFGYGDTYENYRWHRSLARAALRIDSSHGGGNSALGWAALSSEFDWDEAEFRYLRAIESDPSELSASMGLAYLYTALGRPEEASRYLELLAQLDPRTTYSARTAAVCLTHSGKLEAAIESTIRAMGSRRREASRLAEGILTAGLAGRWDLVDAWAAQIGEAAGRTPHRLSVLSAAHARRGDLEVAQALLAEMKAKSTQETVLHSDLAYPLTAIGQRDEAIDALERAYAAHEHSLIWLNVSPMWDPLRGHPRFRALLEKMSFPSRVPVA